MSDVVTPAAAPPIVIGPFSNVPAPGSPIRSDWPQQITNFVLQNRVRAITYAGARFDMLQIESASQVVTTNAGGNGIVTFYAPFSAVVWTVACSGAVGASGPIIVTVTATQAADVFNFYAAYYSGSAVASASVRINYIAVGTRVAV